MPQLYVKQLYILKTVMYVYNVYNGAYVFFLIVLVFFALDSDAFTLA